MFVMMLLALDPQQMEKMSGRRVLPMLALGDKGLIARVPLLTK